MADNDKKDDVPVPGDINFQTVVVDIECHPQKDLIAVGTIDGPVHLYSYSATEGNKSLMTFKHHKKSLRDLKFSPQGDFLFTASKDKSIQVIDMEKGAVKQAIPKAHKSSIYTILSVDMNILASGDDDGVLKVWDMRTQKAVMEVTENEDFISDMAIEKNKRILIATSGDGTVSAFDIRKHKLRVQSELFESDFMSLAIMKEERKVVCGSTDGTLNIFNWAEWGNISDRFPGHPMSVDCMAKYSEDVIFTGSIDGVIRAVNILPNRFLGVVGMHEDFPVENLSLSHDNRVLASCSHDMCVKFWDVTDVQNQEIDTSKKARRTNKNTVMKKKGANNDFFADLEEPKDDAVTKDGEDDSDDDSDEDSDDSDKVKESPKKKQKTSQDKPADTEADSTSQKEDRLAAAGDEDKDSDSEGESDNAESGEDNESESDSASDSASLEGEEASDDADDASDSDSDTAG